MAVSNQTLKDRWWPEIRDRETARRVARQAFWAAIVVVGVTALFATLALFGTSVGGVTPAAFLDAAIFGVVAIGLWRMSRTAAVAALVIFAVERILMARDTRGGNLFIAVILLIAFANGIRATFAYHRLGKANADVTTGTPVGPT